MDKGKCFEQHICLVEDLESGIVPWYLPIRNPGLAQSRLQPSDDHVHEVVAVSHGVPSDNNNSLPPARKSPLQCYPYRGRQPKEGKSVQTSWAPSNYCSSVEDAEFLVPWEDWASSSDSLDDEAEDWEDDSLPNNSIPTFAPGLREEPSFFSRKILNPLQICSCSSFVLPFSFFSYVRTVF